MSNITKTRKKTDQIKVHVVNVGYDVKGTDVIAHLVWYPVYPREFNNLAELWSTKHKSVGVAHLRDGDKFDLKKGQRIAQFKIERLEPTEIVEVDELSQTERGTGGFGSTGD